MAHWLEHWTHDYKVVGTSLDSSLLCWVPEQDSEPALFLPIQKWVSASYRAGKVKQTCLCRKSSVHPQQKNTLWSLAPKEIEMGTTAESLPWALVSTLPYQPYHKSYIKNHVLIRYKPSIYSNFSSLHMVFCYSSMFGQAVLWPSLPNRATKKKLWQPEVHLVFYSVLHLINRWDLKCPFHECNFLFNRYELFYYVAKI